MFCASLKVFMEKNLCLFLFVEICSEITENLPVLIKKVNF